MLQWKKTVPYLLFAFLDLHDQDQVDRCNLKDAARKARLAGSDLERYCVITNFNYLKLRHEKYKHAYRKSEVFVL